MKNILLIITLVTLLFNFSAYAESKPKSIGKAFSVQGKIHFYGNRYILKNESGKWFILLENKVLENLIKKLDPLADYSVVSTQHTFHKNNYLLLEDFSKIKPPKTPTLKTKPSAKATAQQQPQTTEPIVNSEEKEKKTKKPRKRKTKKKSKKKSKRKSKKTKKKPEEDNESEKDNESEAASE